MTLQIVAVVVLGLMCGSELNIAVFAHPTIARLAQETHISVRSSFAALFGRVMPFWMAGSAILNLLLLLPFEHLSNSAWRLACVAFVIQLCAVAFSLVAPVPINNRIMKWTPKSFPQDWLAQVQRWDGYHWARTAGLIVAFVLLVRSIAIG